MKRGLRWAVPLTALVLCSNGCDSDSGGRSADGRPTVDAGRDGATSDGSTRVEAGSEADAGERDGLADAPSATDTGASVNCAGTCHGGANPAPPVGVRRESETSDTAVGAHQSHLGPSSWHREVLCADCHVVPDSPAAPGHIDGLPAELTFSELADPAGMQAAWNGTSCTTYCHGATLSGGQATAPQWTVVDGSTACNSCHGLPPGDGHPAGTNCAGCHGAVVDGSNRIKAPELHINGTVEVEGLHPANWAQPDVHGPAFLANTAGCGGAGCHGDDLAGGAGPGCAGSGCHDAGWQQDCTFCHGGPQNAEGAPPEGVAGETATTAVGVGAHTSHLRAASWHRQVQCADCHVVPQGIDDAGHIDGSPGAEVIFSALADPPGMQGDWNDTTCTTYCHGETLSGGQVTRPQWTKVDGTQASACTSCHGMPPSDNHTTSTSCSDCHGAVVDASNQIISAESHINGTVEVASLHPGNWAQPEVHGPAFFADTGGCGGSNCHGDDLAGGAGPGCAGSGCHDAGWQQDCTFCHGGPYNADGAPPEGVDGETAISFAGVGQHAAHVTAGVGPGYDCALCHGVKPTDAFTAGHIDPSPAEVSFGGLATGTSYSYQTNQCSNIYCHGDGNGNNGSAPWTGPLSGGCSACHDDETDGSRISMSGDHRRHIIGEGIGCNECHGCMVNGAKQITDPTRHVDGKKDFCGPGSITFDGTTCTGSCHGEGHNNTW